MSQNGDTPVTKAELDAALHAALEQFFTRTVEYVEQRLAQMSEHFEQRFTSMSEHFDERIYDTETNLLRAFREFSAAEDVRLRKMEADLSNLDTASTLRLAQLEAAVTDLRARVIQLEDRPH